ncbi:MAG: GNAT family N-acetyltransferase [Agriterribacter sp.]
MDLQPLGSADIPLLGPLQPDDWGDIIPAITYYTNNAGCFPYKLVLNEQIAGIGTVITHTDTAWLAHIIVHKDYRNRGLGTLITRQLLNSAPLKTIKTIQLIATDLGEPVYKKLGFKTETEYVLYKDIAITAIAALPHIHAFTPDKRQEVLNIDKQITGEDRSLLLIPHLENAFVYINGMKVEGFYLPTLGEGWIAATANAAGIALMQLRLTQKQNAALPANNVTAVDYLAQQQIPEYKRVKRMILGNVCKWQPENIYNRIGGNLG